MKKSVILTQIVINIVKKTAFRKKYGKLKIMDMLARGIMEVPMKRL